MSIKPRALAALAAAISILIPCSAARADEPKEGWSNSADLGFVMTSGNSESSSFGLKYVLEWKRDPSSFKFQAGGVRAKTTDRTWTAVGTTNEDVVVTETETERTAAENYFVDANYARNITKRFFWTVGAGWSRNEPSGIQNRSYASAGVGNTWVDTDRVKFRTDYLVTYTQEDPVVEPAGYEDSFLGARFAWDYEHQFTPSTKYKNVLAVDLNVDETDDWRGDMMNSLEVALNSRMALKAALRWLYDNRPALRNVPVTTPGGEPFTGDPVFVELDELDTIFTTSLVVNF